MLFLQNRTYVIWPLSNCSISGDHEFIHALKCDSSNIRASFDKISTDMLGTKAQPLVCIGRTIQTPKFELTTIYVAFVVDVYPRDPILAMALCLSVCHKSGFCRNG